MRYGCINCVWEGDVSELSQVPPARLAGYCPVCGDKVEEIVLPVKEPEPVFVVEEEPKLSMDLDGDGDEDKEDLSKAASITRRLGNKLKRKPRKGRGKR